MEGGTGSPPSETDSLLGSNDDENDEEQRPNSPTYSGSEDVEYTGYHRYFFYRHGYEQIFIWPGMRFSGAKGHAVQRLISVIVFVT